MPPLQLAGAVIGGPPLGQNGLRRFQRRALFVAPEQHQYLVPLDLLSIVEKNFLHLVRHIGGDGDALIGESCAERLDLVDETVDDGRRDDDILRGALLRAKARKCGAREQHGKKRGSENRQAHESSGWGRRTLG